MSEPQEVIIPSNPEDRKDIVRVFEEISNAYIRIASQRDFIKDEIAALAEKYELPKKYLNKLAKIHHQQNIDAVQAENETLVDAYRTITGKAEE